MGMLINLLGLVSIFRFHYFKQRSGGMFESVSVCMVSMLMHVCELKLSEANQFWGLNTTILIAESAIVGAYGKHVGAKLISGLTQLPGGAVLEFETLARWQP